VAPHIPILVGDRAAASRPDASGDAEGASVVVNAAAVVNARVNTAADEPGRSGLGADHDWEQSLSAPQLRGVLRALEAVEAASSLATFRHAVLDGIENCLGYPHVAFLVDPEADCDPDEGRPGAGLPGVVLAATGLAGSVAGSAVTAAPAGLGVVGGAAAGGLGGPRAMRGAPASTSTGPGASACARGLAAALAVPLTKRFAALLGEPGTTGRSRLEGTGFASTSLEGAPLGWAGPTEPGAPAQLGPGPDRRSAAPSRGGLDRIIDVGGPGERRRLERLLSYHGARDSVLIDLSGPSTLAAMLVVVDPEPGAFDADDLMVLGLFGRHVAALFRHHGHRRRAPSRMRALTGRARTVVSEVADGHTNREIAEGLGMTVDTVKHIVRRSMATTGCANRTQLALAWQREHGRPLDAAPLTGRRRAG